MGAISMIRLRLHAIGSGTQAEHGRDCGRLGHKRGKCMLPVRWACAACRQPCTSHYCPAPAPSPCPCPCLRHLLGTDWSLHSAGLPETPPQHHYPGQRGSKRSGQRAAAGGAAGREQQRGAAGSGQRAAESSGQRAAGSRQRAESSRGQRAAAGSQPAAQPHSQPHTEPATHRASHTQSQPHREPATQRASQPQSQPHREPASHRASHTESQPHTEPASHRASHTQSQPHREPATHSTDVGGSASLWKLGRSCNAGAIVQCWGGRGRLGWAWTSRAPAAEGLG